MGASIVAFNYDTWLKSWLPGGLDAWGGSWGIGVAPPPPPVVPQFTVSQGGIPLKFGPEEMWPELRHERERRDRLRRQRRQLRQLIELGEI